MTKRTYRYRQWLKYLKSDDYKMFDAYKYMIEPNEEMEGFLGLIPLIRKKGIRFGYGPLDMKTIQDVHDKIVDCKPPKAYY